ncbi:MAG: DNA alkylation repair protein [Elusimicrobiota bacterium]|nr:DNA alkylation repair protein [Elusimicrobiota bacterium]
MKHAKEIIKEFLACKDDKKAKHLMRFFKTGKGQYGQGDLFLGAAAAQVKARVKKYASQISFKGVQKLLDSKYHEIRNCGFLTLVHKFERAGKEEQKKIYNFYIKNLRRANNWDLVDLSCYKIAGRWLQDKSHKILFDLAEKKNLWQQRVAMVSTMHFVKAGHFDTALKLAEKFLDHEHDLMHKASGWILREAGKKDIGVLYDFLDKHAAKMPRTMLRYAIEKLPKAKKDYYMGLGKKVVKKPAKSR